MEKITKRSLVAVDFVYISEVCITIYSNHHYFGTTSFKIADMKDRASLYRRGHNEKDL